MSNPRSYSDPLDAAFGEDAAPETPREPPYLAGLNAEQREAVLTIDGFASSTIGPFLGPKHRRLFLSFANEDDPFLPVELRHTLFGDIVFAFPLAKLHDRNLVVFYETLDCRNELLADRSHQRRRGDGLFPMVPEEPHGSVDMLQARNIEVQIHPIDAFHFQSHVRIQYLCHRLCYFHSCSVRSVLPLRRRLGRSLGPIIGGDSIRPRHEPANGAFYLTGCASDRQSPGIDPYCGLHHMLCRSEVASLDIRD